MKEEKYIDYIDVFEEFYPVYDIENEVKNYWKQFIPTDDFKSLLEKFLDSLVATNPAEKKPIFVQGRYGTGKSHATSVIKHLLWDPYEDIEDFINKISDPKIRERLKNYRLKNRIFPVTLKGISTIFDHKSLVLTIEKAVKKALESENILINVKTDFEKYIDVIENTKYINWDDFIEKNPKINILARNKEELVRGLKDKNIEVLKALEENFPFQVPIISIEDWLTEVSKNLKKQNISGMCIYWDEFTSLFELPQSGIILSTLQNIAEKTPYSDVYLFIISHRSPSQTQYSKEDFEKILGRFNYQDYRMEEITTYHIMANIIKKKDIKKWEEKRDQIYKDNRISTLIWELSKDRVGDGPKQREAMKNIFPIHPYTAYIATKLAEYIGSTQRSIFKFYNDSEKGFAKFIKDYPYEDSLGTHYFLLADYLWDYFYDEFSRSSDIRFRNILEKEVHLKDMRTKGKHYEAIYKGILLLNIITSLTTINKDELYVPSVENIKRMFVGTIYEKYLDEVLSYISEQGYISKTPDDLFLISSTPLPPKEVDIEKDNFRKDLEKNILKAFSYSREHEEKILKIFQDNILRPVEICLFDAETLIYEVKRKLKNDFHNSYSLKFVVFLPRLERDIETALNTIKTLRQEDEEIYSGKIFIVCREPLGEKNFNDLVEYLARFKVAEKHEFREEKERSLKYAKDIINKWIEKIEGGWGEVVYLDKSKRIYIKSFNEEVNAEISKELFKFGPENIKEACENINIWKESMAGKSAEIFLNALDLRDLENLAKNQPYKSLLSLLKTNNGEYIVNKDLTLKENIDLDHPTVKLYREVERKLEEKKGNVFNLMDVLYFVSEPPFGVFPSMIGFALLAFVLRPFVDRLYEARTGVRIDKGRMKEKVMALMKSINKDQGRENLDVRFGTLEERELGEILKELFELKDREGLSQIRWGIREWIKEKGKYPLWSLRYSKDNMDYESKEKCIKVINSLIKSPDKELKQDLIKWVNSLLRNCKTDLRLILKPEKLEEGFKNWVEEKIGGSIQEDELKELLNFLRANIQEEIAFCEENELELKLADWKVYKKREVLERELISTLVNIFGLTNVADLNSLKEKIKDKINNEIKYPLWFLGYIFNEPIRKVLRDVENFLRVSAKLADDTIENLKNELKAQENLLVTNLKPENGKNALKTWLEDEGLTSFVDNIDELVDFIRENLQKEPFLWVEEDLKNCIVKYRFVKFLEKIFNVKHKNNLKELKNSIKNSLGNLKYPFWAFESKDNSDINNFIAKFTDYVNSTYDSVDFYQELVDILDRNEDKFYKIFDENRAKNNLREFIAETLNIKSEDLEETTFSWIVDNIRLNMNVERFHFSKQEVENYIYKNSKKYKDKINEKKKDKLKNKIITTNKDLRQILIRLIDENPSICDLIERMLN